MVLEYFGSLLKLDFQMTSSKKIILVIVFLVSLSIFLNFLPKSITEPDNIYHIAYADLFRENGLFFTDFSWQTSTIFEKYQSDLWYGYHVLISFFVDPSDYDHSMKMASSFFTSFLLIVFYLVIKKVGAKAPLVWTIFLLFSHSSELIRMTNLRPQVLISGMVLILFYYLYWDRNRKLIFIVSVLFSFFETPLSWLPICIFGLGYIAQCLQFTLSKDLRSIIEETKQGSIDLLLILSGVLVGFFLRPNPVDGLKLFYYQIIDLAVSKMQGVVLPWGLEVYPAFGNGVITVSPLFIFFGGSFLFWFLLNRTVGFTEKENRFLRSSYFVSFFFLALTLFVASRGLDFFILFSVLSLSLVFSKSLSVLPKDYKTISALKISALIIFLSTVCSAFLGFMYFHKNSGTFIKDTKAVSEYLAKNTPPGSIVGYTSFGDFPGLFLWNRSNRYLNSSDPIFQYAYDRDMYQEFLCSITRLGEVHDIYSVYVKDEDVLSFCSNVKEMDLLEIYKNKLNADYLYLDYGMSTKLIKYIIRSEKTKILYYDKRGILIGLD